MTWEHIADNTWTIPAEMSKNGEENRVPIQPMLQPLLIRHDLFERISLRVSILTP